MKESVWAATARRHMERIGKHLSWHGGLSIDYIAGPDGDPNYIDANPRLAEIGNALAAGLNLPKLLVEVSLGNHPCEFVFETEGIRSFMGIQGQLRAASDSGSSRKILQTLIELIQHRGIFAGGTEELTQRRMTFGRCSLLR